MHIPNPLPTPSIFTLITSHPTPPSTLIPLTTLLILDSSFNPPTRAHAYLIKQAISRLQTQHTRIHSNSSPSINARILLLLSTKNADKPSAPASTLHRVRMMGLFAEGIWRDLTTPHGTTSPETAEAVSPAASPADTITAPPCISGIDIALSSQPRFLEKSVFLSTPSEDNPYPGGVSQWLLLGFDTLVRLLDGKYYEGRDLSVLRPLFERGNRVLVVKRGEDGQQGEQGGQGEFVGKLGGEGDGGFDGVGWEAEWGRRVELVDGFEAGVSSTKVREAAGRGSRDEVREMCDGGVAKYVLENELYGE